MARLVRSRPRGSVQQGSETLHVRKANVTDAAGIVSVIQKAYDGNYSIQRFTDPETLKPSLQSPQDIWFVADSPDGILGVACTILEPWNGSFEAGRVAVSPLHQGQGIARRLTERAIASGFEAGHSICTVCVRTDASYRLARWHELPFVGFLPGITRVRHFETFLLCYDPTPEALKRRRSSAGSPIYELPAVQKIAGRLDMDLEARPATYPDDGIVGHSGGTERIHVVLRGAAFGGDAFLIEDLDLPASRGGLLAHLQADVLVHRTDLLRRLERFGFRMVGFLPAWVEEDGERYDAVRLVNCPHFPSFAGSEGQRCLDRLVRGFGYEPAGTPPPRGRVPYGPDPSSRGVARARRGPTAFAPRASGG